MPSYEEHPIPHGSASGYERGCREECCRKAHRERMLRQRQERAKIAKEHPEWVPHGVHGYKNWGCRCEVCSTAQSEALAEYRKRKKAEQKNGGVA